MRIFNYINRLIGSLKHQTDLEDFLRVEYRKDYESMKRSNILWHPAAIQSFLNSRKQN